MSACGYRYGNFVCQAPAGHEGAHVSSSTASEIEMVTAARDHLEAALRRLDAAARAVYDEDDVFTTKTEANVGARIERDQALGIALDRSQEALNGEHIPVMIPDIHARCEESESITGGLLLTHIAAINSIKHVTHCPEDANVIEHCRALVTERDAAMARADAAEKRVAFAAKIAAEALDVIKCFYKNKDTISPDSLIGDELREVAVLAAASHAAPKHNKHNPTDGGLASVADDSLDSHKETAAGNSYPTTHTCINTATTVDGSVPPSCKACNEAQVIKVRMVPASPETGPHYISATLKCERCKGTGWYKVPGGIEARCLHPADNSSDQSDKGKDE